MRGLLIALCALLSFQVRAEEKTDLPTRPCVTQPIYVSLGARAAATIILFPGSNGM